MVNTLSIAESIYGEYGEYENERVENAIPIHEEIPNENNVDETPDETDDATSREDAAINGITHGIIHKYIREPIFNYPCYSPRLHDQMNDPISLFGNRQYSKWLRNFIFSGIIKQKDTNRPYCKVNLSLTDLKIVIQRACQVLFGLKTHIVVRRQITWRDYLTFFEMINFLFDLLSAACMNCLQPFIYIKNVNNLYSTFQNDNNEPLFSIFNTDLLGVLFYIPPPNVYKRWFLFELYHGLMRGQYPVLESFLVKCSYWISPSLLYKIAIPFFVVIVCLCFTYLEYFLFGIFLFTVGRLLLDQFSRLIVPIRPLLLYFCCWNLLSIVIVTILYGSFCLCFIYAAYFLCEILIFIVCKMVCFLSSCLIVVVPPFLLYNLLPYCIPTMTEPPFNIF